MSQSVRPPMPARRVDTSGSPIPARLAGSARLAALWTGFGAAALGCFVAVAGALLTWIPDAGATGSSGSTVRAGVLTFLSAQHGGTRLNGVTVHFVPLGLTLIAGWFCWRGGRVLHALPVVASGPVAGRGRRTAGLAAWQVLAYALTCAALTRFSIIGSSGSAPVGAILGAIVVGAVGFGSAAGVCTPIGETLWFRLPGTIRVALRAAVGAVTVFVAAGSLLAAAATVLRSGRFLDLSRGLGRGLSGLPIAALDLLSAPNAILASTSYLAGPGFAVGVHATYAPFGGRSGLVPAFPILAGLPTGNEAPTIVLALMALTVTGAGTAAGLLVRRSAPRAGWFSMLGSCLLAGVFTGLGLGILVAAAGGSLGRDNLRAVGASPGQVALVVAAQVCAIALPVAVGARLLSGRKWTGRSRVASGGPTAAPPESAKFESVESVESVESGVAGLGVAESELAGSELAGSELAEPALPEPIAMSDSKPAGSERDELIERRAAS